MSPIRENPKESERILNENGFVFCGNCLVWANEQVKAGTLKKLEDVIGEQKDSFYKIPEDYFVRSCYQKYTDLPIGILPLLNEFKKVEFKAGDKCEFLASTAEGYKFPVKTEILKIHGITCEVLVGKTIVYIKKDELYK